MLNICNICLRTDINLKISEDSLRNFHDELCDFEVDGYARYCSKCLYLLRKFYNFRNKCIKANILLKKWEKNNKLPKYKMQDKKKLYEKLPTSLGFSYNNTHKIFSYTDDVEDTENAIDKSLTSSNTVSVGNDNLICLKPGFIILDSTCPIFNKDVCSMNMNKTTNDIEENEDMGKDKTNFNVTYYYMNIDTSTCETNLETDNMNTKTVAKNNVNKSDDENDKRLATSNALPSKTNELDVNSSNNINTVLFSPKPKAGTEVEDKQAEKNFLPVCIEVTITNESDANNDIQQEDFNTIDQDMKIKNGNEFNTRTHIDDDVLNLDDVNDNDMNVKRKVIKIRGKEVEYIDIDEIIEEALRSDSSDDEVLHKTRSKLISLKRRTDMKKKKEVSKNKKSMELLEVTNDEPKEKKQRKKPTKQNLEQTKKDVIRRLGNGDVKDKESNVIDVDIILNNLDTMVEYTYCKVKKYCAGNDPLTSEAIEYLARIQKRYLQMKQYSDVFITKHLTTDEEVMEEFRKREASEKYVQCKHKCTRCFRHFKTDKMLKLHTKEYHDANKPHKCRYCEVRLGRLQPLYRHVQTHRVVYQCKLCPLVTSYITVMKSHYNYHKGVRYPCTKCDAVFKTPPVLAAHMNYVHQTDHICECCARKFFSKQGLIQHKLKKHQNDVNKVAPLSAKCKQCNIQFISDEVFEAHQLNSHNVPKRKLIAGVDNAKKKRKPTLNRRTPRYSCRLCKAVEPNIGALMWHFKSAHPNEEVEMRDIALRAPYRYLCHECGKEFNNITTFSDHKNEHTGVRPYACSECPKAFYYRTHLRNHMNFHLPPTKLCPHCGKAFRSDSNLCNHLRQHAGTRRYACKTCAKTFIHRSALTAHIRSVHLHIRRKRKLAKPLKFDGVFPLSP